VYLSPNDVTRRGFGTVGPEVERLSVLPLMTDSVLRRGYFIFFSVLVVFAIIVVRSYLINSLVQPSHPLFPPVGHIRMVDRKL